MTDFKLYTDTHIDKQVALQLRQKGVDIVRCEEVGMAEAMDSEHLEYAAEQKRAVISNDQDFLRLAQQWLQEEKEFWGVFFCQSNVQGQNSIGKIVSVCLFYHEAIQTGAATVEEEIKGQVIYIS